MLDTELVEAVRILATVFTRRNISHALIGGLGVGVQARPRATKDVDFILQVPALALPDLLEELAALGFEIEVPDFIRRWSADRMIAFNRGRVRVDWLQPVLPLFAHALNTAVLKPVLDFSLRVATPEGLILTKMVAFRPQDQADIVALLAANRDDIDVEVIHREWAPYADSEAGRTAWLDATISRILTHRGMP
jgi:hypothetical protein